MKNKRIVKIGIVLGVATAIFLAILNITEGTKPFKDLVAEDIVSATVEITPPGETVEIKNTEQLTEYLKHIVVYREDHSYQEYAGQSIIFTLCMSDGTQKIVMPYNPFVVIDGIGYRTAYTPCEDLCSYANRLLS